MTSTRDAVPTRTPRSRRALDARCARSRGEHAARMETVSEKPRARARVPRARRRRPVPRDARARRRRRHRDARDAQPGRPSLFTPSVLRRPRGDVARGKSAPDSSDALLGVFERWFSPRRSTSPRGLLRGGSLRRVHRARSGRLSPSLDVSGTWVAVPARWVRSRRSRWTCTACTRPYSRARCSRASVRSHSGRSER